MDDFVVKRTSASRKFKLVPAGSHLARCYRLVDLGTQKTEYLGTPKINRKIMLGWELFGEDEDGQPLVTEENKPMAIFKNYTMSWADMSTLRKDLQSWRNKAFTPKEMDEFDLKTIVGAYCMLNVVHKSTENNIYANVGGIGPVPTIIKQAGLPSPVNENQIFMISKPDMRIFETFGEGLRNKIESSPEWQMRNKRVVQVPSAFDDMSDDVPF
jgi:hypothetical protein